MVNKNGMNKVTTSELKVREKGAGKEGRMEGEESRWGEERRKERAKGLGKKGWPESCNSPFQH